MAYPIINIKAELKPDGYSTIRNTSSKTYVLTWIDGMHIEIEAFDAYTFGIAFGLVIFDEEFIQFDYFRSLRECVDNMKEIRKNYPNI